MRLPICATVLAGLRLAAPAYGQYPEFAFGLGYGHLFWDGHNSDALEEQGGLRMDIRYTWQGDERRPEFRVGAGLGLAFYISEHDDDDDDDNGGFIFDTDDYAQLTLISPELQVSWRHHVTEQWYLEPGLAGTLFVGNYVTGEEFFGLVDEDIDRWRVGGGGRAFLRLGFMQGHSSSGLEGSYSYGWIDFGDDIGGDIQQGYLGVFYSHAL